MRQYDSIVDTMSSEKVCTRTRILVAAWDLLEAEQPNSVRMTDIASRVGISRQALYLHFKKRSELLIATTRYIDEVKDTDTRLVLSRSCKSGKERLNAFIDAWGNYIPEIHAVARALLAMKDTDKAAALAWNDRMQAVRLGCKEVVKLLHSDKVLSSEYTQEQAIDLLWTLLSVQNWQQLTLECGWTQAEYIKRIKFAAKCVLIT